jgi:DNA-directed RNA polymerase subunit E'/Rpb7
MLLKVKRIVFLVKKTAPPSLPHSLTPSLPHSLTPSPLQMFSLKSFKYRFEVHPRCLSVDWKRRFLETLRKDRDRTITQASGVTLEVQDFESVDSPVVHNGKIFVTCVYNAIAFSPSIGELYSGKITLVLPLGILIESEGLVKVLIQPINMPSGYKFDSSRKVFSNGLHSYKAEDIVTFRVMNIKYKVGEINCIGSLKDIPVESENGDDNEDESEIIEPCDDFIDY